MFARLALEEAIDTLSALSRLGNVIEEQGRLDEAEALYREALDKSRRALTEEHLDTQNNMANVASVLDRLDRSPEAEPLWRELLALSERLRPVAIGTLAVRSRLGGSPSLQGKFDEAEPLLLDSFAALEAMQDRPRTHKKTIPSVRACRQTLPEARSSDPR